MQTVRRQVSLKGCPPVAIGAARSKAAAVAVCLALLAGIPWRTVGQEPRRAGAEGVTVFAAASLTNALPRALEGWRGRQGVEVRYVFDASSRLAPQVEAGAPADVLITADRAWMDWAQDREAVRGEPVLVAGNRLVLVERAGSRAGLSLDAVPGDLSTWPEGRILLAGDNVPAGRYGEEALRTLGHWEASEGRILRGGSVRSVLEAVVAGAVPMGIVYLTDARVHEGAHVVLAFPESSHEAIGYYAAVATSSKAPGLAEELIAGLGSEIGRQSFARLGFSLPESVIGGGEPGGAETQLRSPAEPVLPDPGRAVVLSLVVAMVATVAALPLALFLGWVLARREFPGRAVLAMLVLTPLVLPPVVTGFLLLSLFGGGSPLGRFLSGLGVEIPFTILGAVVAAAIVGIPLYVAAVRGAFESVDPHLEEIAWTLGVRPRRAFLRVTLPLAAPGIAAGAILAFARALGEFGATVVLAGNLEGETRTIALAVYTLLEAPSGRSTIWILVGASLLLSGGALLGYEVLNRRQRARLEVHR